MASGSTPPPLPPFRLTTRWWRFVPPGHLWPSTSLPGPLPSKPRSPPLLSRPRLSLPQPLPRPPLLSSQRVSSPLGLGPPHHPLPRWGGRGWPAWLQGPARPPPPRRPLSSLLHTSLLRPLPSRLGAFAHLSPRPSPLQPSELRSLCALSLPGAPPLLRHASRCTPLSVRLLSARCAPLGPPSPSAPRSPRAWPRLAWGGSR